MTRADFWLVAVALVVVQKINLLTPVSPRDSLRSRQNWNKPLRTATEVTILNIARLKVPDRRFGSCPKKEYAREKNIEEKNVYHPHYDKRELESRTCISYVSREEIWQQSIRSCIEWRSIKKKSLARAFLTKAEKGSGNSPLRGIALGASLFL